MNWSSEYMLILFPEHIRHVRISSCVQEGCTEPGQTSGISGN